MLEYSYWFQTWNVIPETVTAPIKQAQQRSSDLGMFELSYRVHT